MLGYKAEEVEKMISSIRIAYEIIDGPENVEADLLKAADLLEGLLSEGHIS